MTDAVRVFVGTSPAGEDAEACLVCEYGLKKRASLPVEITWLRTSRDPAAPGYSDPRTGAGWRAERWPSPWTGLRWAVPALCGWRGRAIYLDCPQIVLGDVAALAATPIPPRAAVLLRREGRALHLGCMVWDCAAARGSIPELAALRADLAAHQAACDVLSSHPHLVGPLPAGWGLRDADFARAPHAATGSVHCANLYMQPHARPARARLLRAGGDHWFREVRLRHYCAALTELFDREYAEALAAGYLVEQYVPNATSK